MTILADWLSGGVAVAILGTVITLVRLALGAERRRADDWRTAAQASTEANKLLTENLGRTMASMEQLAASQRDMLALLRTLADDRRGST